jgi:hypothetical protein
MLYYGSIACAAPAQSNATATNPNPTFLMFSLPLSAAIGGC